MPSPAGNAPPPGDYTSWDEYMRDVERTADLTSADKFAQITAEAEARRRADYEANRDLSAQIEKAMRLAPNIAVFKALMAGQKVPVEAMDQYWAKRYRLIRRAA